MIYVRVLIKKSVEDSMLSFVFKNDNGIEDKVMSILFFLLGM